MFFDRLCKKPGLGMENKPCTQCDYRADWDHGNIGTKDTPPPASAKKLNINNIVGGKFDYMLLKIK